MRSHPLFLQWTFRAAGADETTAGDGEIVETACFREGVWRLVAKSAVRGALDGCEVVF